MAHPGHDGESSPDSITLFLSGDVMLGRGVDQILPHPGDPRLYEPYATSAASYVELAEQANGEIPRRVAFSYVWGDVLAELQRLKPDLRIINLETSITKSGQPWPKGINYKMSPDNVGSLTAMNVDCCVLANNHVMDWGRAGLLETLATLEKADIASAGAGRSRRDAAAPAILKTHSGARVLVFGFGATTSGIPADWAAGNERPGINLLENFSDRAIADATSLVGVSRRPGDLLVASIHWGENWGYRIPDEQRGFARRLIDRAGFDVVHGHSSHHAKGLEIYGNKLILYGCGDFLDDYEGIKGYEMYRDDLAVAFLPRCSASNGNLLELTLVPFQIRKFRLNRAAAEDVAWLQETLDRECTKLGTRIVAAEGGVLRALWQ